MRVTRREILSLFASKYNEVVVSVNGYPTALGLWRSGNELAFNLYPGRFEKELLKHGSMRVYVTMNAKDFYFAAVEKVVPFEPAGWYLAFDCELNAYLYSEPALVHCSPTDGLARPAPPPSRAFFYMLEAIINITRIKVGIKKCLKELIENALRLATEDEKRFIKEKLMPWLELTNC